MPTNKKHILVVEDEVSVRTNLVRILEMSGFAVSQAENGRDALSLLEGERTDLIISDVMMPVMDGYEFLKQVRGNSRTASTPFLFLTAKSDRQEVRAGMNLGADDYIPKPFRLGDIVSAVNSLLAKAERSQQRVDDYLKSIQNNLSISLPHEFLTPVTGILGYAQFISSNHEYLEKAEIVDMVESIQISVRRLLRQIQNFVFHAELERVLQSPSLLETRRNGLLEYPGEIIHSVLESVASAFNRHGDCRLSICEEVSLAIQPADFQRAIEELFRNAFAFSQPGQPVEVRSESSDGMYHLLVLDEGLGMTDDQINDFGPFKQYNREMLEQQGAGLGLSIVLKVSRLCNGAIKLQRRPEAGMECRLSIPIRSMEVA